MATTKFEVGKVYITMQDKFGDGEQAEKSVVIERTAGTVTFRHLASGEIFVREIKLPTLDDKRAVIYVDKKKSTPEKYPRRESLIRKVNLGVGN